MTTQEILNYYVNLLIIQYAGQQKSRDTVAAQIAPIIMDQLPVIAQDAFSLETAIGVQLDVLGKYAGVTRYGYTFTGPITLNDDDFRLLIKIQIIQNAAGSSLDEIQNLLHMFFSDTIFVFDLQNMFLGYLVDSSGINQNLVEVFVTGGFLPKPMAVGFAWIIYVPDIFKVFGFGSYEFPATNVVGFDDYETGPQPDWHWIDYADALTI